MDEVASQREPSSEKWYGPLSWLETFFDVGPALRRVEIEGPDGKVLARWQGWSLSMRGAIANADRLRSDRQPRTGRSR